MNDFPANIATHNRSTNLDLYAQILFCELGEPEKDIMTLRTWLVSNKRNQAVIILFVAALAGLIGWGLTRDPVALALGMVVGIVLAILISWLR